MGLEHRAEQTVVAAPECQAELHQCHTLTREPRRECSLVKVERIFVLHYTHSVEHEEMGKPDSSYQYDAACLDALGCSVCERGGSHINTKTGLIPMVVRVCTR